MYKFELLIMMNKLIVAIMETQQTGICGGECHENICITAQQRYKGH